MSTPGLATSLREEWILSRIKPDLDGESGALQPRQIPTCLLSCQRTFTRTHRLDESLVLVNYLNKTMSAESAARAITAGCPDTFWEDIDQYGARRISELWGLLAAVLLRFEDDCDMIVDLLVAIQTLPSINNLPWWAYSETTRALCQLPNFDYVWQDCYESLICQCHFGQDGDLSRDRKYYRRAGTVEAKMYLRGVTGITQFWAYKTINIICERHEEDLEFVIYEIHGWLRTAGPKLAQTLDSSRIVSFERAVRGRRNKFYDVSATMFEHWQHWKKSFLEVSFDEQHLSSEARRLARECHDIMKAQNIRLPLFV